MPDIAALATKFLRLTWLYLRNFSLNTARRLRLFLLGSQICWQQQRLRRHYRRLGEKIFSLHQEGDLNPLLHELVKDSMEFLKKLTARKTALQETRQQVRDLIRQTSYTLSPNTHTPLTGE